MQTWRNKGEEVESPEPQTHAYTLMHIHIVTDIYIQAHIHSKQLDLHTCGSHVSDANQCLQLQGADWLDWEFRKCL